ncbi:type I-C CRISPR-associated protein Cas8c/Csd1 [Syntrophomonas erecta]
MIIQSLYHYYQRLADEPQPNIPKYGYSIAGVSFAFNISIDGELLNVVDLRQTKKNKLVPIDVIVPEQNKRSSGLAPNFLCDNSTYIIGVDRKGKEQRAREALVASAEYHSMILGDVDDPGAKAICKYFIYWQPEWAKDHKALKGLIEDITSGVNIVFMLDGYNGYIHERLKVRQAWDIYRGSRPSELIAQCLVTGKTASIAKLHPNIKGVPGAQSSGASLVSFNQNSFVSFGKNQNFNSPISEEAAFSYTTVLNYLLNSKRHRMNLNDNTVTVFWSEASSQEEDLIAELLYPTLGESDDGIKEDKRSAEDWETIQLVRDTLRNVRDGNPVNLEHLDARSKFYVLGLSSNAARLSVRFWQVDRFRVFVERIAQHYADMAIERANLNKDPEFIPIPRILQETAPLGDKNKIPPLMGGTLMRSVLSGKPYPQGLYTTILARIRADKQVNYIRAATIKGCLIRQFRLKNQEVNIYMSLDEKNTNTAYRLGRLFAVLEKAQQDALGNNINATIRDKYFGSASATPAAVFPMLIRLAQHHIAKSEYGYIQDRRIQDILDGLDGFPQYLNMEEQGKFMLGYYHQRQAFYKKGEGKNE